MKKVIVLMTTYNGDKFIEEQINSIINQDYPCSVAILDDCSSDSTYQKLKIFTNQLPNFSLRQNLINNGIPGANFFNLLKENVSSQNDYFAFSDQDDFWEKDKISRAIQLLESTNSQFYCSELNLWDGENVFSKTEKKGNIKKFDYLFQSASAGCTCVISRFLAEKIVSIIEDKNFIFWKNFSHDWFLYFITRMNRYRFVIDNETKIKYRIHSNNNFGTLSIFKPETFFFRLKLLSEGWYQESLKNMIRYVPVDSEEHNILTLVLSNNFFERMKVTFQYGKTFRRNLSHRIVLQTAILVNRF